MQMFSKIRELIMEPNYFLCVLIDEVESLAHARNAGSNDAEPADSMRVVNALLTQIDSIRRYKQPYGLQIWNLINFNFFTDFQTCSFWPHQM